DEVAAQEHCVGVTRLTAHMHRRARVRAKVANLAGRALANDNDVVAVEHEPEGRGVRVTIRAVGGHTRDQRFLQKSACFGVDHDAAFPSLERENLEYTGQSHQSSIKALTFQTGFVGTSYISSATPDEI